MSRHGERIAGRALDILTVATVVATEPKKALFTGIRLIRSAVAGQFSEQLRTEWDDGVARGKIKPDYAQTDQARTIFADALVSLADANFDAEQLDLLRRLFLAAASETVTDRRSPLVREYLAVGCSLSAGEIDVLAAYYRFLPDWLASNDTHLGGAGYQTYGVDQAIAVVGRSTGLKHTALIDRHERSLIDKGLIRGRGPMAGAAQVDQKIYRFTDFGLAFCQFIDAGELR